MVSLENDQSSSSFPDPDIPLARPVLPLVAMVEFLYLTGPFQRVDEVLRELPSPIETRFAVYEQPEADLRGHLDSLRILEEARDGTAPPPVVVNTEGQCMDRTTAWRAVMRQQILTRELEAINSALCAPCGCTLCCTGPGQDMIQEFFEIPLSEEEKNRFDLEVIDSPASRAASSQDEQPLLIDQKPFYRRRYPVLMHWQAGWSLILPKSSSCPHLDGQGRCRIYPHRPEVCRRPQIFPYILERLSGTGADQSRYRLRDCLLAVVDCPYVRRLRQEIAAFGAACELEVVFRQNKA